jgi:hypothetical protein
VASQTDKFYESVLPSSKKPIPIPFSYNKKISSGCSRRAGFSVVSHLENKFDGAYEMTCLRERRGGLFMTGIELSR